MRVGGGGWGGWGSGGGGVEVADFDVNGNGVLGFGSWASRVGVPCSTRLVNPEPGTRKPEPGTRKATLLLGSVGLMS